MVVKSGSDNALTDVYLAMHEYAYRSWWEQPAGSILAMVSNLAPLTSHLAKLQTISICTRHWVDGVGTISFSLCDGNVIICLVLLSRYLEKQFEKSRKPDFYQLTTG